MLFSGKNDIIVNIIMIRKIISSTTRIRTLTGKSRYQLFDSNRNYYEVLKVPQKASESQIKQAYYKLAKQYHPDLNSGSDAKIKEVNQAYEVLSDPQKRSNYDGSLAFGKFTRKMRRRAGASQSSQQWQFGNFQNNYQDLSEQEKEQVRQEAKAWIRRLCLYLVGSYFIWWLISRRPHRTYKIENNELVPAYNVYQQNQSSFTSFWKSNSNQATPITEVKPFEIRPFQRPRLFQNQEKPGRMQSNYTAQGSNPQAPEQ